MIVKFLGVLKLNDINFIFFINFYDVAFSYLLLSNSTHAKSIINHNILLWFILGISITAIVNSILSMVFVVWYKRTDHRFYKIHIKIRTFCYLVFLLLTSFETYLLFTDPIITSFIYRDLFRICLLISFFFIVSLCILNLNWSFTLRKIAKINKKNEITMFQESNLVDEETREKTILADTHYKY